MCNGLGAHAPFWTDSYKHHLQLSVYLHVRLYKNHTTSSRQTLLGPDGIFYTMLKLSLPAIVGTLVRLFNASLRLGEVPEEWKDAVVIRYLCTKVGRSLRRIRWVVGQSPWPPAWPGFLRNPSTCKSESISRWTNSFTIISLVSTAALHSYPTVLPNSRMDNGSGLKAVHSSSFPGFEQGIQPGAYCRPAF